MKPAPASSFKTTSLTFEDEQPEPDVATSPLYFSVSPPPPVYSTTTPAPVYTSTTPTSTGHSGPHQDESSYRTLSVTAPPQDHVEPSHVSRIQNVTRSISTIIPAARP